MPKKKLAAELTKEEITEMKKLAEEYVKFNTNDSVDQYPFLISTTNAKKHTEFVTKKGGKKDVNPLINPDSQVDSNIKKLLKVLELKDNTLVVPQDFLDKAKINLTYKTDQTSLNKLLEDLSTKVKPVPKAVPKVSEVAPEAAPESKKVESVTGVKQEARDPFKDKRSLADLLKELEKYVTLADTESEDVLIKVDDTYATILDKFISLRNRGYETLVNNWPESKDKLNKISEQEKTRYLAIKKKGNNAGNIELALALKENEATVVDEAIAKEEDTQSQMVSGVVPNSVSKTNEEEEDTLESEKQEITQEITDLKAELKEKNEKAQKPPVPVPEPPGPVPEPPGPDSGGPSEPIPADVNTQESTNQSVTNPQTTQYAADQITAKHPPKYHLYSIFLFFGDKELPEWDYELENNIFSSGISEEDAVTFMDDIVEEFGKKIFVKKRMSKSLDELNELTQLEFCWQRNLARGRRSKNALIKVEDIINLGLGNEVQNDQPTDKPEEANGYVPQETQVQFKKSTDQEISDLVSKKEYDFNGKYLLDDDVVNQVRTKRVHNNIGPTNMQDDAKSGFSKAPLFMGMPSVDPGIVIISNAPPTKKVKTNKVKPSITF